MYMNIEPDGHAHLVVFYNSNPSEFYLTPFPSLTFRSIGGIFDIYIFTGPTPVQALEQFQQVKLIKKFFFCFFFIFLNNLGFRFADITANVVAWLTNTREKIPKPGAFEEFHGKLQKNKATIRKIFIFFKVYSYSFKYFF